MGRGTALRWIALVSAAAACSGGDDLLLPGSAEPASVALVQGDQQNGRVGEALPQPLVAAVTDANGRPVQGATVLFVLSDPPPGASVSPDTAMTGADGNATASVVLGTRPGAQSGTVEALNADGAMVAQAGFTLTALSEDANTLSLASGDGQSAPVGAALPAPLVVSVADAFGNPIPGVAVAWSADGGGAVSEQSTSTDANGQTSITWTLGGAAGTQHAVAAVDRLVGSPVTFTATATAGAASGVTAVGGNGQSGPVNTELSQPLVVEVRDAQHNAVPGVAVTWVIGTGGGSITPETSTTDADGRASAAWTLGAAPGTNTVSAVVSGIGVAEFTATATGGAPPRLGIATQPGPSATSGVPFDPQPVVQLLDGSGNPVRQAGVGVQVAITSGAGTLQGSTTQPTDGDGRAAFAGLAISGPSGARTLRFSADGFAAVTSQTVTVGAAATTTTITSDQPDPSAVGDPVTVQVTVTSAAGTPTGTVTVQDGNDSCPMTLSNGQGTCALQLNTAGDRTLTASYAGADGFAPSSATESHTVQAAPQQTLAMAQQPSSPDTAGMPFPTQPAVQLQVNGENQALAGIPVTAAIRSGGGSLTGTITATTDPSGRATFADLAVTGDPGPRTLVFQAPGYTEVVSTEFDVQSAAAPTGTAVGQ
jgi:hypothetical protein